MERACICSGQLLYSLVEEPLSDAILSLFIGEQILSTWTSTCQYQTGQMGHAEQTDDSWQLHEITSSDTSAIC